MEWTEKALMVAALNQGEYKEAVNIMLRNEDCIDDQAMQMFANGFSLLETKLLQPIKHIIHRYAEITTGDFRADVRIGVMLEKIADCPCHKKGGGDAQD